MSEMIERVAGALRDEGDRLEYTGFLSTAVSEAFARAVLRAMREPTQAMIKAGAIGSGEDSECTACGAWESMIDAALGDAKP